MSHNNLLRSLSPNYISIFTQVKDLDTTTSTTWAQRENKPTPNMNKSILPWCPWLVDSRSDGRQKQFGSSLLLYLRLHSTPSSSVLKFPPTTASQSWPKQKMMLIILNWKLQSCRTSSLLKLSPEAITFKYTICFPSFGFSSLAAFPPLSPLPLSSSASKCCFIRSWQTVHKPGCLPVPPTYEDVSWSECKFAPGKDIAGVLVWALQAFLWRSYSKRLRAEV